MSAILATATANMVGLPGLIGLRNRLRVVQPRARLEFVFMNAYRGLRIVLAGYYCCRIFWENRW